MTIAGYNYVDDHLVSSPYTQRKRLMIFDASQLDKLSKFAFEQVSKVNFIFVIAASAQAAIKQKRECSFVIGCSLSISFGMWLKLTCVKDALSNGDTFRQLQLMMFIINNIDMAASVVAS